MPVSRAMDSEKDMEEERRLMYVAITRAREKIYFTRSKSRYLYGKREPTARSVFLKELQAQLSLPDERPVYKQYEGDFGGYGNSYNSYGNSYNSYGNGYGGYQGYGSQSSSYNRYKQQEDEGVYRTFGGNNTPSKNSYSTGMGGTKKSENTFSFAKKMTATSTAQGKDESVYAVGTKVSHPRFGEGTVVSLRGGVGNVIITVDFGKLGRKELSARLAPLTVIR